MILLGSNHNTNNNFDINIDQTTTLCPAPPDVVHFLLDVFNNNNNNGAIDKITSRRGPCSPWCSHSPSWSAEPALSPSSLAPERIKCIISYKFITKSEPKSKQTLQMSLFLAWTSPHSRHGGGPNDLLSWIIFFHSWSHFPSNLSLFCTFLALAWFQCQWVTSG